MGKAPVTRLFSSPRLRRDRGGGGGRRGVGRNEVAILIGIGLPGEYFLVNGASEAPAGSQLALQEESRRNRGIFPAARSLHSVIGSALRHKSAIGVAELGVW